MHGNGFDRLTHTHTHTHTHCPPYCPPHTHHLYTLYALKVPNRPNRPSPANQTPSLFCPLSISFLSPLSLRPFSSLFLLFFILFHLSPFSSISLPGPFCFLFLSLLFSLRLILPLYVSASPLSYSACKLLRSLTHPGKRTLFFFSLPLRTFSSFFD